MALNSPASIPPEVLEPVRRQRRETGNRIERLSAGIDLLSVGGAVEFS
jgi:hypothetical protein